MAEKIIADIIEAPADLTAYDVRLKDSGDGLSVSVEVDGHMVGFVYASRPYMNQMHSTMGKATLNDLFKALGTDLVFNMVQSELERDYRGTGIGSAMYLRLLREVDKKHGWLTSALFGSTSDQAMRVWASMAKYAREVKKVTTAGGIVWCARGAK